MSKFELALNARVATRTTATLYFSNFSQAVNIVNLFRPAVAISEPKKYPINFAIIKHLSEYKENMSHPCIQE